MNSSISDRIYHILATPKQRQELKGVGVTVSSSLREIASPEPILARLEPIPRDKTNPYEEYIC